MNDYSNTRDATSINVKIQRLETIAEVSDRQIERLGGKVETLTRTIDQQLPALTHQVGKLATAMDGFQSHFNDMLVTKTKFSIAWGVLVAVGLAVVGGLVRIFLIRAGG